MMPRYESPYDPSTLPKKFDHVIYEKQGHVAYVTINRPEVRNALHSYAYAELRSCWRDIGLDPNIYVGIVTGVGDAFCAGRDVKFLASYQAQGKRTPHEDPNNPLFHWGGGGQPSDANLEKPLIAAINGFAVGVGLSLALQWPAHRRRMLSPGHRQQGGAAPEADRHLRGDGGDDLRQLAARRAGRGAPVPPDGGLPAVSGVLCEPPRPGDCRERGRSRGPARVPREAQAGVEDALNVMEPVGASASADSSRRRRGGASPRRTRRRAAALAAARRHCAAGGPD